MDKDTIQLVEFLVPIFLIVLTIKWLSNSPHQYKNEIATELEKNHCELVSIKLPRFFQTGPFTPVHFKLTPSFWRIANREQTKYRIVYFKNQKGEQTKSWVKISAPKGSVTSVKWIPAL